MGKAKKFDIGVDMTLFDHWNITIDYFYDKRYDIFMERQSWPNSLGYGKAKPWGNVGKMDNKGVEFSLNYHKNFSKDLGASFQANLTYNKISWFIKTNRIILLFGSRKQENHIPD